VKGQRLGVDARGKKNNAGPSVGEHPGRQKDAGRRLASRSMAFRKHYLLMESLLIEPPLSILTLMMWIEFLSV